MLSSRADEVHRAPGNEPGKKEPGLLGRMLPPEQDVTPMLDSWSEKVWTLKGVLQSTGVLRFAHVFWASPISLLAQERQEARKKVGHVAAMRAHCRSPVYCTFQLNLQTPDILCARLPGLRLSWSFNRMLMPRIIEDCLTTFYVHISSR